MPPPKVFVSRVLPDDGMEKITSFAQSDVWEKDTPPPYEVMLERVQGKDGILSLLTDRIDETLMEAAGPALQVISQMAVGYDNIDVEAATRRDLPVGNTPGVLTETTADFAFALILAAGRRIVEGVEYVQAGSWKTWGPTLLMGRDVHGATLGVIGLGRIGQAVARRARGFDMQVVYYDPSAEASVAEDLPAQPLPFDEVLARADFLTLHVPLTPETRHMIGQEELRRMKPTSVLVNTARGEVIDAGALYQALVNRQIAYAALDVTDPEPIPPDDPLLDLENCIVVPHMASASVATRNRMAVMAADNLIAGLRGERLPHCLNPEVY